MNEFYLSLIIIGFVLIFTGLLVVGTRNVTVTIAHSVEDVQKMKCFTEADLKALMVKVYDDAFNKAHTLAMFGTELEDDDYNEERNKEINAHYNELG